MRKIIFLLFFFSYVCVANTDNKWPHFDENTPHTILVAGYVVEAEYLTELVSPECNTGEFICMDPPPLKLEIEIETVVYGEVSNSTIYVFTTSHYGKRQFDIGGLQAYLFLLETDGSQYKMPRYHFTPLAYLEDGLALPMRFPSDTPFFLPCEVKNIHEELNFDPESEGVLLPIEIFFREEIKEMEGFAHISKYAVRVLNGIGIMHLKKYFNEKKSPFDFNCHARN